MAASRPEGCGAGCRTDRDGRTPAIRRCSSESVWYKAEPCCELDRDEPEGRGSSEFAASAAWTWGHGDAGSGRAGEYASVLGIVGGNHNERGRPRHPVRRGIDTGRLGWIGRLLSGPFRESG